MPFMGIMVKIKLCVPERCGIGGAGMLRKRSLEEIYRKPTEEEKIIRARSTLLLKFPFFGHLALSFVLKEDVEVETMGTDGVHLYYDPAFVAKLEPKILETVVAHEALHCALGHLWRREWREHGKWNRAADHADNLILKKQGFVIPANCLCDDKFEGMGAEEIYSKLPDNESSKNGKLMDSHDTWGKGEQSSPLPPKPSQAKGDDQPEKKNKSQTSPADGQSNNESGSDSEDTNKAEEGDGTPLNKAAEQDEAAQKLQDTWKERMVRAANAARMQGKLPGELERLVQDVLEPVLDWRAILHDLLTSDDRRDFRLIPPSKKHLWRGIYLPSVYGQKLEVGVGVDTSGSVSREQFQEFLAEVRGIAEQFDDYLIHLFFCDARIHDRSTLTPQDDWPESFPKRDGGTSFVPVFKQIEEEDIRISTLVYLTDGYGDYPEYEPDYRVIWVLNSDKQVPWGEEIRLKQGVAT